MWSADAPEVPSRTGARNAARLRSAAYWSSTSIAALAFAAMGAANLAHADPIIHGLAHLGYPSYFATILGAWKVLAAAALVLPGLRDAREWAYAGIFFTLTGAALSHAFAHDAPVTIVSPLVLLVVAMASWSLWRRIGWGANTRPSRLQGVEPNAGH